MSTMHPYYIEAFQDLMADSTTIVEDTTLPVEEWAQWPLTVEGYFEASKVEDGFEMEEPPFMTRIVRTSSHIILISD